MAAALGSFSTPQQASGKKKLIIPIQNPPSPFRASLTERYSQAWIAKPEPPSLNSQAWSAVASAGQLWRTKGRGARDSPVNAAAVPCSRWVFGIRRVVGSLVQSSLVK
jgi:hypothetical protein